MERGTAVLQVNANDIDLQPSLRYSIDSGNHDNAFVINQRTGMLSVAKQLDFERVAEYQLNIQVCLLPYLLKQLTFTVFTISVTFGDRKESGL